MTPMLALFLRPPLGWPMTAVLFGAVVAVVVWTATRRGGVGWPVLLRLVSVAALGWVLLGPSEHTARSAADPAKPELVLLVDTSLSMAQQDASVPGQPGAATRLDALRATWLSPATLETLRSEADVRIVAFDERQHPADVSSLFAQGKATHLYDEVDQHGEAVVVVLSDGHDTSNAGIASPHNPASLGTASIAFAVPVGASQGAPDAAAQAWAQSDRLFDGQSTTIEAQVYHRGFGGSAARVELLLDGAVIDTRDIVLDTALQQVAFEVIPTLAPRQPTQVHAYACRVVVPGVDEAYTDNNTEPVYIQVTREKVRVLVLEGEPYWDTRSLARLIGSHPGFDLTALYALGDRRRVTVRGDDSPLSGELTPGALRRFDVVVLGRHVQRLVDEQTASALAGFVEDGGAVVLARGQAFEGNGATARAGRESLTRISPAALGERDTAPLQLAVSDAARGNPLTDLGGDAVVSRLPGMIAATRVTGRQAASVVLLESANGETTSAAVSTLRLGRGVTLSIMSDGLWRWELLPRELAELESVYAVFWTRALQWLASGGEFLPGQDVSLAMDRLTIGPGGAITARVTTRYAELNAARPMLRLIAPDGSATKLPASAPDATGASRVHLAPEALGGYRVELTVPGRPDLVDPAFPITARFSVVDRSPERRDTAARPEVLQQLAQSRGGRCLALDEVEPVLEHLRELRLTRTADDAPMYRFATWPVFTLICFGLGAEWFLRRRGGLL